jgi:hypothetical protein
MFIRRPGRNLFFSLVGVEIDHNANAHVLFRFSLTRKYFEVGAQTRPTFREAASLERGAPPWGKLQDWVKRVSVFH